MKKRISIFILCIMAICLVGCQAKHKRSNNAEDRSKVVSYDKLDEVDQTMIQTMSRIYKICKNNSGKLWPKYNFQKVPLLMVRANKDQGTKISGAYSFNVNKFDKDMRAVEVKGIPKELGLKKVMYLPYVKTNDLEKEWSQPFNFDFANLQGVHTMYFKYYPKQDMHRKFVQFLTHEAFHEFLQVKVWKNVDDLTTSVDVEGKYKEEVIQIDMLRAIMAEKMMRIQNKDDLKAIVKDSMILQQYLFDKYPSQKQQKQVETVEGSAQYVCIRIDNLINGEFVDNGSQQYFTNYHVGFAYDWDEMKDSQNWKSFFDRDIFYDTGAAYMTALNRLGVGYKSEINNKKKLLWDCLMKECFPNGCTYDEGTIQEIKKKYGYNKYHKLAVKITEYLKQTGDTVQ